MSLNHILYQSSWKEQGFLIYSTFFFPCHSSASLRSLCSCKTCCAEHPHSGHGGSLLGTEEADRDEHHQQNPPGFSRCWGFVVREYLRTLTEAYRDPPELYFASEAKLILFVC